MLLASTLCLLLLLTHTRALFCLCHLCSCARVLFPCAVSCCSHMFSLCILHSQLCVLLSWAWVCPQVCLRRMSHLSSMLNCLSTCTHPCLSVFSLCTYTQCTLRTFPLHLKITVFFQQSPIYPPCTSYALCPNPCLLGPSTVFLSCSVSTHIAHTSPCLLGTPVPPSFCTHSLSSLKTAPFNFFFLFAEAKKKKWGQVWGAVSSK